LNISVGYWSKLLETRGELYFARHAPFEMAALASDVRVLAGEREAPVLHELLAAIDRYKNAQNNGQ
jgi:hypothetical protein